MKKLYFLLLLVFVVGKVFSQSTVLLPNVNETPRLNFNQILALPSPKSGSMVFDTDANCLKVFNGLEWKCVFENSAQMAKGITGGSNKGIIHSTIDALGNLYVFGQFGGTVDFGGISLTALSSTDLFVLKYSKNNQLLWANRIGSPSGNYAGKMAVSENGDVYVTGLFVGSLSVGAITLNSYGLSDIFVFKYDLNGNVIWGKNAGSSDDDWGGEGIIVDNNNVYLTGGFRGTATFGPFSVISSGANDVFLTKLNSNGDFQWVVKGGSSATDRGICLSKDESGNIYLGGMYGANASFGSFLLTNGGNLDIFLAKYNSDGLPQWVNRISGSVNEQIYDLKNDNLGNIYAVGMLQSNSTFYSTSNSAVVNAPNSGGQFIAKYNLNGNLIWAKRPFSSSSAEMIAALAIDQANNLYTIGSFAGNITFRGETFNGGTTFSFLSKMNSTGEIQWIKTPTGSVSGNYGSCININPIGDIYALGSYISTCTFGSVTLNYPIFGSGYDLFIWRVPQN